MAKCEVRWIDCRGNPTPDTNDAVAVVTSLKDIYNPPRRFYVCSEHLHTVTRGVVHKMPCKHYASDLGTWDWEYIGANR